MSKLNQSHTPKNRIALSGTGDITADSEPVYDTPLWPLDEAWNCYEWMVWHKKMKEKYGQETANERFLNAWSDMGYWEWNKSWCKYNDEFFEYFRKQGLDAGNFVSKIINNTKDTAVNTSEGAKSISAGLGNLSLNKIFLGAGAAGTLYLFGPTIKDKIQEYFEDESNRS